MTIPSTARKAGPLLGTGAQTAWPFTFKVFAAADVAVTIADSLGVETALVLDTDYSVTLNANQETSPGGTVTYPISGTPLAVGSKLSIIGDLDYDQPLDLPSGGNFSPLALENQLDRTIMQVQQLEETASRALLVPVTSSASSTLPNPEPNALIGWDSTGDTLANYTLAELATGIAYGTMRFDTFTGNGSTTQFALTEDPAALANLDVSIAGVTQVPGTDYTLTSATLVFTTAPVNGVAILARYGRALPISGPTDSSAVTHTAAGTGAVLTTVQAKLRESVSVLDFGADPTGVADSTAAIQAAVTYAETFSSEGPVEILFTPGGVFDLKMVFITTGGVKLNGNGCTIVQNHDNVNSITVGGAGQYKVSNAFMIKRGAADVEITGFDFTTDDASFPALAAGYGSYFASIGGQFVDRLNIHHNRFRSGQLRALFVQGGKYLKFVDNNIESNGITVHIGYAGNVLFYDGATDTATKYSPIAPYVVGNIFDGFTSTANTTCLFLTGAIRFTVRDNKLLNMNEATVLRPILIYSNDFGPYDEDGTALNVIQGTCEGNLVDGIFLTGIEVSGDSTSATAAWTNSYLMAVNVNSNTVQGTGNGIKIDHAKGANVSRNWVKVDKSPLYIDGVFANCSVKDNFFEGANSGQNATTIFCNWDAGASNFTFCGNIVVTPTGDQYGIRSITNLIGLTMNDNLWDFNSDVAACRGIVLTLGGKSEINNNRFDVDTDTASIFIFSINGNTQTGTLNADGNAVIATAGTGATTLRFGAFENFKEVRLSNNDTGGAVLIEDALRSYIRDNTIILPSGNTLRGIHCDNTSYAQKALVEIHSNYVLQPAALNAPGIGIASNNDLTNNTLSKVTMNRVEGNSTTTLIQQTSAGVIEVIGNTIINNGTGGTTTGVTGTATLVNL